MRSNWVRLTIGPIAVAGSRGSPTRIVATAVRTCSTTSARRARGTRSRVPATQACPLFMKAAPRASGTATRRSASSSSSEADLPVSARLTRFIESTAARAINWPVGVEPVKDSLATPGWVPISAPTSAPRPVTTLTTPGGRSASWIARVITSACQGLSSLGLITVAQPAAMAAASLLAIVPAAAFHGAKSPDTPTGRICRIDTPSTPTGRSKT